MFISGNKKKRLKSKVRIRLNSGNNKDYKLRNVICSLQNRGDGQPLFGSNMQQKATKE